MSGLRYALAVLVVLMTAGCETPGSPPRYIIITLSSGVEKTPYSPEQLENPVVRAIIKWCERQLTEGCGSNTEPIDNRNEFRMGEDSSVYTLVKLGGVAPNRTYEVEWRLFDPDDGLLSRFIMDLQTPLSWQDEYTLDYTFRWTPDVRSMWFPGRWRVEIFVNGFKEGQRYFYVRKDGNLETTRPGVDEGVAAFDQGNYEVAWKELYPLALAGDARAEYYIGNIYHFGFGTAIDLTEASKWYRRSAIQDYPSAQNNLGNMYLYGRGVEQDSTEALRLFHEAADSGVFNSMYSLAEIHTVGIVVPRDLIESLKWLTILKMTVVPGIKNIVEAEKGNTKKSSDIESAYNYVIEQMHAEQIDISRQRANQWMREHGNLD